MLLLFCNCVLSCTVWLSFALLHVYNLCMYCLSCPNTQHKWCWSLVLCFQYTVFCWWILICFGCCSVATAAICCAPPHLWSSLMRIRHLKYEVNHSHLSSFLSLQEQLYYTKYLSLKDCMWTQATARVGIITGVAAPDRALLLCLGCKTHCCLLTTHH